MSMYDETKKVVDGCDELMNQAIDQMDLTDILQLDETTIKAMVTAGKLYVQSKDSNLQPNSFSQRIMVLQTST